MKNKVQLITYADRLGDGTIKSMTDILRTRFDGVYDGVHILPFFTPFDGADAGFDPIDHTKVDERLGSWDDVAELSKTHDIMVDAIVNHMSWESKQFQDVLAKGEESEYYPMFLTMSSVFPNGATEEDLAGIYRPRPGLPFTHYKFAGKNDMELLRKTNNGRDINRHYYSTAEIDENLKRPVVKALNALAKFRNELDAFDGTFSYTTDDDTSISFTWRGETSQATLTFEPKRGLGVDNTTPVAMLEWEDSAGDHRSDDLIANPPVVA